jgi:hypothetical protein
MRDRHLGWSGASVVMACLVCGCGDGDPATADAAADATPPPDASPPADAGPDVSCAGDPAPTTAPATVNIDGRVTNFLQSPIAGATVTSLLRADDSPICVAPGCTATSAADGAYALILDNPSQLPIDGYLRFESTGNVPSNLFGPGPTSMDLPMANAFQANPSGIDTIAALSQVTVQPGDGLLFIRVGDCDGLAVAGATVSVSTADVDTRIIYAGDSAPDPALTTTGASGVAFVFNVPPGTATIGGDLGGTALDAHPVTIFADELALTLVNP